MAIRIAGVDIPQNKRGEIALTYIFGIGRSSAAKILAKAGVDKDIKVAVMGCVVNGPGEAREADIGVAGGVGCGLIFRKGEVLRKVSEEDLLPELLKEIEKL